MKTNTNALISTAEAEALIAMRKSTIRPMEWIVKKQKSNPQWLQFQSSCRVILANGSSEIREDIFFVSQFRARKTVYSGAAEIEHEELFNASLLVAGARILAIDADSTEHTNKVGRGRPWYGKTLPGRFHLHRWTDEGYGYAEPVEEGIDDIELLIDHFLPLANLTLAGGFVHPLKNHQVELPL